jgi:hypothetical protein
VLESLQATPELPRIHYWRDKAGHEVDFILPRGDEVDTLEVKWSPDAFSARTLGHFRSLYPQGRNLVVTAQTLPPHRAEVDGLELTFVGIEGLRRWLGGASGRSA